MLRYIQQAWLVLLLALVFGLALAGVNAALMPRIETNQRLASEQAALKVVPDGQVAELLSVPVDGVDYSVYKVLDGQGRLLGWAVPAQGMGYADTIKILFGVTPDGTRITGLEVLYSQETPGLGNKIADTKGDFQKSFPGQPTGIELRAPKRFTGREGEVHAITGATISSEAVAGIVNSRSIQRVGERVERSALMLRLSELAAAETTAPAEGLPLPIAPATGASLQHP